MIAPQEAVRSARLRPDLGQYRGLSGLDSALFVLLAVSLMQHAVDSQELTAGAWAPVAFLAKLGWEGATGGGLFVRGPDPGPAAVPLAHLAGAAAGFVVGAAGNSSGGGSRKTPPMPPLYGFGGWAGGEAAARSAGRRNESSELAAG